VKCIIFAIHRYKLSIDLPSAGCKFDKCDAEIESPGKKCVASVESASLETDKSDVAMKLSSVEIDKSDAAMKVPEVDAGLASSECLDTALSDETSVSTFTLNETNISAGDNLQSLTLLEPGMLMDSVL
jgi:hypothetical protein